MSQVPVPAPSAPVPAPGATLTPQQYAALAALLPKAAGPATPPPASAKPVAVPPPQAAPAAAPAVAPPAPVQAAPMGLPAKPPMPPPKPVTPPIDAPTPQAAAHQAGTEASAQTDPEYGPDGLPADTPPGVRSAYQQLQADQAKADAIEAQPWQTAEYKGPKKALTVVSAILGSVFPKFAPFVQGLEEGAERKYESAKNKADEVNRGTQEQSADAERRLNTDKSLYDAQTGMAERHANIVAARNEKLTAQGIDPATNKPFVIPPDVQKKLLTANKGGSFGARADAYRTLADTYEQMGASGPAKMAEARADAFQRQQDFLDTAQRETDTSHYTQQQEDERQRAHENFEQRMHDTPSADTLLRLQQGYSGAGAALKRQQALTTAGKDFTTAYKKATTATLFDPNSPYDQNTNPYKGPPELSATEISSFAKMKATIDASKDPVTTADKIVQAGIANNPTLQNLLYQYGGLSAARRGMTYSGGGGGGDEDPAYPGP